MIKQGIAVMRRETPRGRVQYVYDAWKRVEMSLKLRCWRKIFFFVGYSPPFESFRSHRLRCRNDRVFVRDSLFENWFQGI